MLKFKRFLGSNIGIMVLSVVSNFNTKENDKKNNLQKIK